jgi:hypothetical protein
MTPYRFLQNHGKHLMAVFSVFLMIAFTLPSAYKRAAGASPVIATIGDGEKIHGDEAYNAKKAWELLNTIPVRGGTLGMVLGPAAATHISKHPVEFLLLQKEAEKMGVSINRDQLETELANTPGLITTDDDRNAAIRRAVSGLLLIRSAFERAAGAVKISEPMVKQDLAQIGQTITVNTVEFNAAKYTDKVKSPTADQLKTQFEKYADQLKGGVSSSNPHGFGYRYPDRVKLQYIVVPRAEVRKMVEASKDEYAWRVEAQKQYIQNPEKYKATQPAESSNNPFSLGTGGVKTKATTKPFAEAEADIKKALIEQETNRRMAAIMERINSTMATDWVGYSNALNVANATTEATTTTSSTTAPSSATTAPSISVASSLKAPYNGFEYLQKLAAAIQAEFKVLPTVVSVADKWQTANDISKLPGIGKVTLREAPFAEYATRMAAPFVAPEFRSRSEVLKILEPTQAMIDENGSTYVARLSEADPSHKPATFVEVEQAVRDDVISAAAYDLAKADAEKLLDAARQKGLTTADAAPRPILPVGPLTNRAEQAVPVLNLTGPAAIDFLRGAFALITTPTSRPSGQPVALIEIPRDGRAIVTELAKVQASWTQKSLPFEVAQVHAMASDRLKQDFARNWFDFDSLATRLKYVPDKDFKDTEAVAPPPQPVAPTF